MNLQELVCAVPVHTRAGQSAFVRIMDIPNPWRNQFIAALHGSACPVVDGAGPVAFAHDWQAWTETRWPGRSAPAGLGLNEVRP
jgi:hypothetical protein